MRSAWFVLILLLATATVASAAERGKADADSTPAPSFSLPTRTGTVSSDSLKGQAVFVDFWASWCEPCRRSFPWLASLHERYAARGLTVLAINLDKDREAANAFLRRFRAPFQVAFDPSGRTAEAFQVSVMPSSFLVSPSGLITYAHTGFSERDTAAVEARIREVCRP
jgi:cytochrome c biogenesis protein CcmG, thiol:disulfide interchange protein DsbE